MRVNIKGLLITYTCLVAVTMTLGACNDVKQSRVNKSINYVTINNLENEFREFLKQSSGKDFETKVTLWGEIVEAPHQVFYDEVIWNKEDEGFSEEERLEDLEKLFLKYDSHSQDILDFYPDLLDSLTHGSEVFQKRFPDFSIPVQAYLAPGVSWGGSVVPADNGINYLPLGVDLYEMRKMSATNKAPRSLVPHELFHAYNRQKSQSVLSQTDWLEDGRLFWQLWGEGLAMYGAHEVLPELTLQQVMLHPEYLEFTISPEELTLLSRKFLDEFSNPAIDLENPINYKKWFGVDSSAVKDGLPPAIGYYLGYLVVEHLIKEKNLTIEELSMWSMDDAEVPIKKALESFSE